MYRSLVVEILVESRGGHSREEPPTATDLLRILSSLRSRRLVWNLAQASLVIHIASTSPRIRAPLLQYPPEARCCPERWVEPSPPPFILPSPPISGLTAALASLIFWTANSSSKESWSSMMVSSEGESGTAWGTAWLGLADEVPSPDRVVEESLETQTALCPRSWVWTA